MNLTIFGQPVGPDWGRLGLELLIAVLVLSLLSAVGRFLFSAFRQKLTDKTKNETEPPALSNLNKTVQDQTLGIRCTHCDTKNPAGVTTCIGCGKRLF